MSHTIKTVYVVHHSHTDIGYTDLQERVVQGQVNYIRSALRILDQPENENFRWNCETWFCVEEFLKTASPQETEAFFARMQEGKIGFSANYLNFCDLLDTDVLSRRLDEVRALLDSHGVPMKTSMFADVNGISMGHRDALIDHGVEFLYTNIHCHHGMYPMYQNQTAYWWENAAGKRLLVWNGEHYNLGNVLGLKPNRGSNFMTHALAGKFKNIDDAEALERAKDRLENAFCCFGIQERFDESLLLLAKTLGLTRLFYERRNVLRKDASLPPLTDRDKELAAELNQADAALYAFAVDLLERRIAEEGPAFAQRVETFRVVNGKFQNVCELMARKLQIKEDGAIIRPKS